MFTKQILALASAFLATEALAANTHRHAHQHLHNKKDIVYKHTEVVVFTEWVTVTVFDEPTSSVSVFKAAAPETTSVSTRSRRPRPKSSSSSSAAPPPPPPPAPSTSAPPTTVAQVETQPPAPAPQPTTKAAQVEVQAPAPAPTTANTNTKPSTGVPAPGGSKRGLAYNDAKLLSPFMGSGSKCSWSYNWAQRSDGLAVNVEFVPMLWGPIDIHTKSWAANAEAAISGGAKNFLSFNECDNKGQCNLDASSAAREHIRLMNPYSGRVRISSPAVTNSNLAGEGLDWLKAWVAACNGNCAFDFCAAHWYSPPDPADFLGHLEKVHDICQGKPVWVTEFAPISGDESAFLAKVMAELDTNPKYSFVERYSYFMVAQGKMLSGATSLNAVGNTFAYA